MSTAYKFYEVMGYPIPLYKEFFAYKEEIVSLVGRDESVPSREFDERMQEYIRFIKRRQRVRKRIPFVEAVYLANSLTFNHLHENSDIDLFIVATEKRLRLARFFSNTILFLLGLKRRGTRIKKKFCLSFYVTHESCSLLSVKEKPADPYLVYRLAHLVPLYFSDEALLLNIREENERIRNYLPNFPMRQTIQLGIEPIIGRSRLRRKQEGFLGAGVGLLIERMIKVIWIPILLRKKRRLGPVGEYVIISNTMLKFHADKRKKYQLLRKVAGKE